MFTVPPGAVPGQRITVRYLPSIQQQQQQQQQRGYSHDGEWAGGGRGYARQGLGSGGYGDYGSVAPLDAGFHYGGRGAGAAWSSPRRPGRPPGAVNLSNRPAIVRQPQQPVSPRQLTRRLVLMHPQKHEALQLAAQYNTSLFIINSEVVESGLVRLRMPLGRAGRRPNFREDPQMMLIWHLASQIPARALVLIDIHNESLAEGVARGVQHHARHSVRDCLSWRPVGTFFCNVVRMRSSASGSDLVWRLHEDGWGYCDADTGQHITEPFVNTTQAVDCLLPTLEESYQWIQIGHALQWLPVDISAKPLPAFQLFRAAVKPRLAHQLAVQRQREGEQQARVTGLLHEHGNLTLAMSLVSNMSTEAGGDEAARRAASALALAAPATSPAGPQQHALLAAAASTYPSVRGCFYNNGWNVVSRQLDNVGVEWGRAYHSLYGVSLRIKAALQDASHGLAALSASSIFGGHGTGGASAAGAGEEGQEVVAAAGSFDQGSGSEKLGAGGGGCEDEVDKEAADESAGDDAVEGDGAVGGFGGARMLSDRHVVERVLRQEWKRLSDEGRGVYERVSTRLAGLFEEALELRKVEERRRRHESFSLGVCVPTSERWRGEFRSSRD